MHLVTFSCYLFLVIVKVSSKFLAPCESHIYCQGDLLHTIQMAELFPDSKTFVDMKMRHPPKQILKNFELFSKRHELKVSKKALKEFVKDNFEPAGSEFEDWDPKDWKEEPRFLKNVSDPSLRSWASKIHSYWKLLGRKIKEDVKQNSELYSMIYVPNPVIVPGGRFREFYYWDTYWIIEGLLLSEMYGTVRGMLENFMLMVESLGYVPNGGRKYFERSQPPFLIPMVKLYLDKTNDVSFVRKYIYMMDREYEFWLHNRTASVFKDGKSYNIVRYNVERSGPRPESYREDFELAQNISDPAEKNELYFNLKSGAESGWDFSSRWFKAPIGAEEGLVWTKTRDIAPVDLNSLMYMNAKILAEFHLMAGDRGKSQYYENVANNWKTTINEVLWNEEEGCWFDYDIKNNHQRIEFFTSNLFPLWAEVYNSSQMAEKVMRYFKKSTALHYPGGVPTSLSHTGEQWDFPNAWSPHQHIIVEGLIKFGSDEAVELAEDLAQRWISNNYEAFIDSKNNHMFEKYDVTTIGYPGGGGEYEVVVGFGWTNGVVLSFLNRFGRILAPPGDAPSSATKQHFLSLLLFIPILRFVF